jgi:hypothetical protein
MINGGNIYICSDENLKMLKVIPMNLISRTFQLSNREKKITDNTLYCFEICFEKSWICYNIKTFRANIIQVD